MPELSVFLIHVYAAEFIFFDSFVKRENVQSLRQGTVLYVMYSLVCSVILNYIF